MTRLILATIAALAGVLVGLQPAKAQAPWCAVITVGEDSVIWGYATTDAVRSVIR